MISTLDHPGQTAAQIDGQHQQHEMHQAAPVVGGDGVVNGLPNQDRPGKETSVPITASTATTRDRRQ